jgi:hypothetical protein
LTEFFWTILEKIVGKPFDNYIETVIRPAVGNHLWLFIVVPVSFALPWLIKHRERLPDWVFRARAGQRQAALSVAIGLLFIALGTTPPFQPAGHGKIAGALAVPLPKPNIDYLPDLPPAPEKHETKRPEPKPIESARVNYRLRNFEEPIAISIDIAVRQLPVSALPEFDAAPHMKTLTPVLAPPNAPASIRVVAGDVKR